MQQNSKPNIDNLENYHIFFHQQLLQGDNAKVLYKTHCCHDPSTFPNDLAKTPLDQLQGQLQGILIIFLPIH